MTSDVISIQYARARDTEIWPGTADKIAFDQLESIRSGARLWRNFLCVSLSNCKMCATDIRGLLEGGWSVVDLVCNIRLNFRPLT